MVRGTQQNTLIQGLMDDLTRVELLALVELREHLGLESVGDDTTLVNGNGTRHWTKARRSAHSRRMKAYWRARRSK